MRQRNDAAAPPLTTYSVFRSPLGWLGAAARAGKLVRLAIDVSGDSPFRRMLAGESGHMPVRRDADFHILQQELDLYFCGRQRAFTCRYSFDCGTPFQRRVWRQLARIPYGATWSYQRLARAAGQPRACRAAGNANGRNPLPILIPCHRVIKADGSLGGYTGGPRIKRFLLDLERRHHGPV